ncbi:MAG: molecular chaperone SurA, partial [Gammaproteobacteria bacterium]|nr:molecular chaperone SurA [Gammaproteobacteria bacterium]
MMRNLVPHLLPAFLLLLIAAPQSPAYELDGIVAVVNEDVIVRSELEREITLIMTRIQERGTRLPPPSAIERQVLERMVKTRLQLQSAERLGIKVDESTLARAIANIAKKNGLSLAELRDTLESEGMDFNSFRKDTRERIILARLRTQEVVNRITVTDREVDNFVARNIGQLTKRSEVQFQHILVATPENASPEEVQRAKDKAQRLVAKLRG